MDLNPARHDEFAPAGTSLFERPNGPQWPGWQNLTIEHSASGLGPYQSRTDHWRITITGGTKSNRTGYDLPFACKPNEARDHALAEYASGCNRWKDQERAWHENYISRCEVTAKSDHWYVLEVDVKHAYLD